MRDTISTAWHAFLDYLTAFTLLCSPWIFTFDTSVAARNASVLGGGTLLLMAILTRNEGGIFRVIPMPLHLNIDVLVGFFLIAFPFVFDTSYGGYVFYIALGIVALWASIYTKYHPHKGKPPVEIKYDTERKK